MADKKEDLGLREPFSDFENGVAGVANFGLQNFMGEYLDLRIVFGNALKYAEPVRCFKERLFGAQWGVVGGTEQELVQ